MQDLSPLSQEFIQMQRNGMTADQAFRALNSGPMKMYSKLDPREAPKVLYTWHEIMTGPKRERRLLLAPMLQAVGLAAIAGPPDCGKSTFCRQLAAAVSLSKNTFCGFTLTPRFNRAIYVSTEEPIEDISEALAKQWDEMTRDSGENKLVEAPNIENKKGHVAKGHQAAKPQHPAENLRLIFTESIDTDELLKWLDRALTQSPADLIVIDSFGDILIGRDGNSNTDVRRTLHPFYELATIHKCLVLFVTHLNKNAYTLQPDQVHVQGGSSMLQKVRVTLDLRMAPNDSDAPESTSSRYLTITKGNRIAPEYKSMALKLEFDEEKMTYLDKHDLVDPTSVGPDKQLATLIDWNDVFGTDTTLPTAELKSRLRTRYDLRDRQARERISMELEKVEVGVYRRLDQ